MSKVAWKVANPGEWGLVMATSERAAVRRLGAEA